MDDFPKFEDTLPVDQKQEFPKFEDTLPVTEAPMPKFEDTQPTPEDRYGTPGQQALTAVEGLGRGVSGGLSDALAVGMRKAGTALGVSPENLHYIAPEPKDIAGRQQENPFESGASELVGNVGMLNKLPQIGSKAVDGMIKMGLISGGDEISKAMLGQGNPADAAAAHIAGSSALGLLTGGIFGKIEKLGETGLKALENAKLGKKISSWLAGAGHAASFPDEALVKLEQSAFTNPEIANFDKNSFEKGQKFFRSYAVNTPKYIARGAAPIIGQTFGGLPGSAASIGIEQALEHIMPKVSQKYVAPAILKAASSGAVEDLGQIMDHATTVSKGAKKITNGIENLFNATGNKAVDLGVKETDREKLKKFIEDGGVDKEIRDENQKQPQGFATGGQVQDVEKPNAVAKVYPEQNMILSAAKGRISNYLNSVRPIDNPNKLPFDTKHKDKQAHREYDKVLDLANQPLSILNHIKSGALVPKQVEAFKQMYPELHQHLSNKISEGIANHQLDKTKRPPYKVRQAMSLFLGNNLDSTLTQPNIMAAQMVFMKQNAQKQQQPNTKSSLSKLGEQAQTPEQSRTQRLNKS